MKSISFYYKQIFLSIVTLFIIPLFLFGLTTSAKAAAGSCFYDVACWGCYGSLSYCQSMCPGATYCPYINYGDPLGCGGAYIGYSGKYGVGTACTTSTGGSGACDASGNCNASVTPVNGVCGTSTYCVCSVGTLVPYSCTGPVSGTYTWQCAGSNGGSTAYCSTTVPVTNGVCGTSQYSCISGTLYGQGDAGSYYYWFCLGINGGSNSPQCLLYKSTPTPTRAPTPTTPLVPTSTIAPTPATPPVPTLYSATNIKTNGAYISWYATGATYYNLYYKRTIDVSYTGMSTAVNYKTFDTLNYSTAYQWYVQACNAYGCSSASAVSSFTTATFTECSNAEFSPTSATITGPNQTINLTLTFYGAANNIYTMNNYLSGIGWTSGALTVTPNNSTLAFTGSTFYSQSFTITSSSDAITNHAWESVKINAAFYVNTTGGGCGNNITIPIVGPTNTPAPTATITPTPTRTPTPTLALASPTPTRAPTPTTPLVPTICNPGAVQPAYNCTTTTCSSPGLPL